MEDPRRIRRTASAAGIVLALLAIAPRPAGAEPAAKRLRVLVAADEEPEMFSFEPGSAPGLEREMIESFARLHGRRLEVVPVTNFDQIIPTLRAGQGDVILGIVDTAARRQLVGFTEELLPTRHVVATLASRGGIPSLEHLRIQRVGVVTGSSWAEAAAQAGIPASRTVPFVDSRDMVQALLSGQITAMVLLAALTTLGLWALGMPYFLAFGVFAGVAAIVPFFGVLLSTVLPGLAGTLLTEFPRAKYTLP